MDNLNSNQKAIFDQQSGLKSSQLAMEDILKEKISAAKFNKLFDEQLKSNPNLPTIEQFNEFKNQLENLGKANTPAYFSANPIRDFATNGQPIPFEKIISESNSGFDGPTGTMTTKISGLYHFSASIMKTSGRSTMLLLMHNEHIITRAFSTTTGYDMLTLTATILLKVNDKIFIKLDSSQGIHSNSNVYGIFTGVKISD